MEKKDIYPYFKKILINATEGLGIIITSRQPFQWFVNSINVIIVATIYIAAYSASDMKIAVWYFIFSFFFTYLSLFIFLANDGLVNFLLTKMTQQKVFELFRMVQASAFLHYTMSFSLLCSLAVYSNSMYSTQLTLLIVGVILIAIGVFVKLSAIMVVGMDTFYWRDLLLKHTEKELVYGGPYKYLANPMYGLGYMQVYGVAIISGSLYAVFIAALMQAMIYTFYFTMERPHIIKLLNIQKNSH